MNVAILTNTPSNYEANTIIWFVFLGSWLPVNIPHGAQYLTNVVFKVGVETCYQSGSYSTIFHTDSFILKHIIIEGVFHRKVMAACFLHYWVKLCQAWMTDVHHVQTGAVAWINVGCLDAN